MDDLTDIIDDNLDTGFNDTPKVYAHFGWRLLAYFIDAILMFIPMTLLGMTGFIGTDMLTEPGADVESGALTGLMIYYGVSLLIPWLYYAFMESGSKQATVGKMVLGMKVTDERGNKISFGRASGRYWGKLVSGLIIGIGYLMVLFTEKKQGLHDIMANCLVLKN